MTHLDGRYKGRRRVDNISISSPDKINADNTNILTLWSQIRRKSTFQISKRCRSLVTVQNISMPNPPHQWRAHCGYIPQPSYSTASHQYYQHTPDAFHPAHHFAPLPNPPWSRAPAPGYAYTYAYPTETSTPAAISGPPSPQASFWSISSMTEDGQVPGVNPPSGLREGVRYLYPANNTLIHVANSSDHTWNNSSGGGLVNFFIYIVPCCINVRELMELLGGDGENVAVTEIFETGGPYWDKGMTIKYTDEAMGTRPLSFMGWTKQRGADLPPVWMVLHRAS